MHEKSFVLCIIETVVVRMLSYGFYVCVCPGNRLISFLRDLHRFFRFHTVVVCRLGIRCHYPSGTEGALLTPNVRLCAAYSQTTAAFLVVLIHSKCSNSQDTF